MDAPTWDDAAKARILEGLKEFGAWLDEEPTDPEDPTDVGYCVIAVGPEGPDGLLITRPTIDMPPVFLYEVDTGVEEYHGAKAAIFTDADDVIWYVKRLMAERSAVTGGT